MKVAACQMVSGTDLASNLEAAEQLLEQAAQVGAELAVLPEYFCLMGENESDKLRIAEQPGSGPIQEFLSRCASQSKLWVVAGTVPLISPDGRFPLAQAISSWPKYSNPAEARTARKEGTRVRVRPD